MITIPGKPLLYSFWKKINEYSYRCVKKCEDKSIDISSILLPTSSTMIIKFTVLNTGKKYELVIQGKYSEYYKKVQEGEHISPDSVNAQLLVRSFIHEAYEIN
jgi:hypothetical protein